MLCYKVAKLNSQTDLPELYIMHNLLSGKIFPTFPYIFIFIRRQSQWFLFYSSTSLWIFLVEHLGSPKFKSWVCVNEIFGIPYLNVDYDVISKSRGGGEGCILL